MNPGVPQLERPRVLVVMPGCARLARMEGITNDRKPVYSGDRLGLAELDSLRRPERFAEGFGEIVKPF